MNSSFRRAFNDDFSTDYHKLLPFGLVVLYRVDRVASGDPTNILMSMSCAIGAKQ